MREVELVERSMEERAIVRFWHREPNVMSYRHCLRGGFTIKVPSLEFCAVFAVDTMDIWLGQLRFLRGQRR